MSSDKWTIRAVVVGIILITLTALVGGMVLSYQGKAVGDWVVSAIAGGLGAMSALLAKTGYDRATQDVQVVNDATTPVPVVDGPV